MPDYTLEDSLAAQGFVMVAGVDEAGRGPLAGPVACAAVILDPLAIPPGLDDSKRLSAARREILCTAILASARAVAVSFAPPRDIDRLNIRAATLQAMARAVNGLALRPDFVLVDGRDVPPGFTCPARAIIGGDALCASIAAASIVAKVTRDRLMARLDTAAPAYGFARHAGYGVPAHLDAIARHGASPWHRMSFRPLRQT